MHILMCIYAHVCIYISEKYEMHFTFFRKNPRPRPTTSRDHDPRRTNKSELSLVMMLFGTYIYAHVIVVNK